MRKHSMGAAPQSGSWSPKFKVARERLRPEDRFGKKNTSVMSYFPSVKGLRRMEELRHYFHAQFALLLDARPDVVDWTANTSPVEFAAGGRNVSFTADFYVEEVNRTCSVRLLRPGTTRSEASAERHAAAAAKYREREETLLVIGGDELAADPRLPAAKTLFLNRIRDWPEEFPAKVADMWSGSCPTTLGAIHESVGGGRERWHQLLSLAAFGYLHLDIGREPDADTAVTACRPRGYGR